MKFTVQLSRPPVRVSGWLPLVQRAIPVVEREDEVSPAQENSLLSHELTGNAQLTSQQVALTTGPDAAESVAGGETGEFSAAHDSQTEVASRASVDANSGWRSSAATNAPAEDERGLWQELSDSLQFQVEEWEKVRSQSLKELQQAAVTIAMAATKAILARDLEHETARIEHLVELALTEFRHDTKLVVRLHPETLHRWEHSAGQHWENPRLSLVADPQIAPGNCQIDGGSYSLVADLAVKLQRIEQKLREDLTYAEIERRQTGNSHSGVQRFPDRRHLA